MWSPDAMMLSRTHEVSRRARALLADCRGIVAVEFAVLVPIMLVLFFGVVEFSSAVAVNRKVTLVARTLSDLTSQSTGLVDTDIANFGQTAKAIMTPYPASILQSKVSEVYIDAVTLVARVQWSKMLTIDAAGNVTVANSTHTVSEIVTVPAALKVAGTYVIWSEVSYLYQPTIGYVMAKAGVTLRDFTYTRARQSLCVHYPMAAPIPVPEPACPTL
jgi:Flp pilus assembly protein TadG